MTTKLDASHRAVLENWETITQMNQCRDQVHTYLVETIKQVMHKVLSKHPNLSLNPTHASDGVWHQFEPTRLANWKGKNRHLLVLEVTGVSPEALLHPAADKVCFAHVFTENRVVGAKTDPETEQLLTSLKPPAGFSLPRAGQDREYLFEMLLPALTPEEICNQSKLEQYFLEPFTVLVEWYQANEKRILSASTGSTGKRAVS